MGGQWVPLFTSVQPNSLVVPTGQTIELPADSDYDAISVQGTLKVSRSHPTKLRFLDLQILDGGTLDIGTQSDPVLQPVEFIVKDAPFDTTLDPWQWGRGILCLSNWMACGRDLDRTWARTTGALKQGDVTVTLSEARPTWRIGDQVLIPDTNQLYYNTTTNKLPRSEQPFSVVIC